jgi:SMI1-KNR4 cell-wall
MFKTRALIAEWGLPEGIVLLSGDGHSWVALDYRNTKKEPPVIFVESESGRTESIAPNFENFLQRLKRLA